MASQRDMPTRTLRRVSVQVALASSATLVALAFALSTFERWRDGRRRHDRLPQGSQVFGALPRVLAAVASGGGALVVFGGAAWSARRHRRGPRLWANVLIAAGTLILSASGLLNSVLDEMEAFAVTLAIGVTGII